MRNRNYLAIAAGVVITVAAVCLWAAQAGANRRSQLAEDLPSGALMTLQSPDFARLLRDWDNSPEQKGWLTSASFSAFSNSHLWERLTGAGQEFAGAANTGIDSNLLRSIAGTETIFAWYDIGSLQLLYITHLAPGQAATVPLLAHRGKFSERKAGDAVFYIRSGTRTDSDGQGQERTVAFAQRGDYLLLATREDLLANALLRMQGRTEVQGMTGEAWYQAAEASASGPHGELHMLLDLQRITKTPQFETYWIQRNVTDTRRFRAAVVDLYRERGQFREERTLLPVDASTLPSASAAAAALEQLVPERAGVYRIVATPSVPNALTELRDKVLERAPASRTSYSAPDEDLSVQQVGEAHDLETRIDAPQPAQEAADAWLVPLHDALGSVPLLATMTVSRSAAPASPALFVPIHSAVVLQRSRDWDGAQLSGAILAALQRRLTVGSTGLQWTTEQAGSTRYLVTTGAQPVALAVRGNIAILSTDSSLLREMLSRSAQPLPLNRPITTVAEFRHGQEQAAFLRLSGALDSAVPSSQAGISSSGNATVQAQAGSKDGHPPTFFHDTLGSLSLTFSDVNTEHFTQFRDGATLRETVLYTLAPSATHQVSP